MKLVLLLSTFFSLHLFSASIGEVSFIRGQNAKVIRENNTIDLVEGQALEKKDKIVSNDAVIQIVLFPSTQINIGKKSEINLSEYEIDSQKKESKSIIEFIKGELRVLVRKMSGDEKVDQTYRTDLVDFGVRGTEFSLQSSPESSEIEVNEGEVEATERETQKKLGLITRLKRFRYLRNQKNNNWMEDKFQDRVNPIEFKKMDWMRERMNQRLLNQSSVLPKNQPLRVGPSNRFLRDQRPGQ
jgi:hypothetical protein